MAPRLSVVVPIYNVQPYLHECLTSIAEQTLTELEVVMVDDGSTDGSAAIAERFAEADRRFRLIRQENQGLGPARNVGVRNVDPDAEFLAFMDSDDTLPTTAYELMVGTLDATGSDFVSGNVQRFRSVGYAQSPVHAKPFKTTRLRTHVSRHHPLITDRTAWNKVYRREFWDAHAMEYPGILYEDAPVSIPLHFLATSVDVLSEPIYHWRERDAGERSITQNRTDPKGLVDRVTSIGMVRRFLGEQDGPEYAGFRRRYDLNALSEEIPIFFKVLPDGGDAYRTAFLDHVGGLVTEIGPKVPASLPEPLRLKYWLTVQRRLPELLDLLAFERTHPSAIPLRGTVRYHADYPFLRAETLRAEGRGPVPATILRLDHELVVRSGLKRADWQDGVLRLEGFAYPKHLGAMRRGDAVKALLLREQGSRRTRVVPARTVPSPEVTADARDQPLRHCDLAGFTAALDADTLKHRGQWRDGVWKVTVAVFGRGRPRRSRLKAGPLGSGQYPSPLWATDDVRLVPQIRDQHLYLSVETVKARMFGADAETGADGLGLIRLHGNVSAARLAAARHDDTGEQGQGGLLLRLNHDEAGSTARLELPVTLGQLTPEQQRDGQQADGTVPFTVLLDPARLTAVRVEQARLRPGSRQRHCDRWGSALLLPDGKTVGVVLDDRTCSSAVQFPLATVPGEGPRVLSVKASPRGWLQLSDQPLQPLVESVAAAPDGGGFLLEGTFPRPGRHSFSWVLRHSYHAKTHLHPAEAVDGRFSSVLPAVPVDGYAGELPLNGGAWGLYVRTEAADAPEGFVETQAHVSPRAHARLPLRVTARGKEVALQRRWHDRLLLEAARDLPPTERGSYHQRILEQQHYPAARRRPLRDAVLYDVFEGKSYSDSPRAVHQEFVRRSAQLDHLWVVRDDRMRAPAGVTEVVAHSAAWYEALARSRYIVGNTHLPPWIERREGQVIVQTWHGTPLKRIGFDFDNPWFSDTGYLKDLEREAGQWSLLLSPNRFSTPIMRRAFRFQGEILESGYPRNDILLAPDREKQADRVRRTLGLPEDKKVVLYAPTWREDRVRHQGGHQLDLRIDLEQARAALGRDHVLLIRPHAHVVDPVPGAGDGFVWDVGSYPDIQDLFLVADVLVTDYSSVMFDFAVTGRPILFFTYDLEHYRDQLRGFYFDFEKQAPGPLLGTSEQLVDALRDLPAAAGRWAPAYTAFRESFCDLDDGRASERVVDRMLELGRREQP
ncbi:bifunctional glycosyltransferase/CDP-glycerol:glycerophosphate glycerophosphotransferase [Streptacidiphilus cavernicola]|uniref:CDP-glycerol glycerophosphotransferase family protein n=1 Tax=Streptacidiphilus cavernicola TaxID=3342716 RepID=A0ABV6VYZ6_9ACTN